MNYNELIKNYFIIVDIQRNGKTVFVCKNKGTALYDFFELKNDLYTKVDKNLEKQLRLVYKIGIPKKIYSTNNDNVSTSNDKNFDLLINKFIPECKKSLYYALNGQSNETIKACCDKLNTVQFNYEPKDGLATAYYAPVFHNITVNNITKNQYRFYHTLLHELLHSCTRADNKAVCGTMKIVNYGGSFNFITSVVIGAGLNEAITDYIAFEQTKNYILMNNLIDMHALRYIRNDNIKSSYDAIVNIFYTLSKNVDMNTCLHYYFNSDLDGLIDYINKKFHLENNDKFVSLIYKMDSFVNILNSESFEIAKQDLKRIEYEMYKDTIDILLNKYIKESKDINNLKFEDLINNYRLSYDKQAFEEYFAPIRDYFNLKVSTKFFSDDNFNIKEDSYHISNLLINIAYGQEYLLNEKFVKKEFFAKMLSNNIIIMSTINSDTNNEITKIQQKAFKNIFSCDKYIGNKEKRYEILTYLIKNKKILAFDIKNCLDGDFLSKVINDNPKYVEVLLNEDYNKTVNSFYLIDNDTKLSKDFVSAIKNKVLQMQQDDLPYMHLITEYYQSMPLNIRANKMFSGDLCVFLMNNCGFDKNSRIEINEFLAEVKQDEQNYKNTMTESF